MIIKLVLRVRAVRTSMQAFDAASARRQRMPARETEAIILKTFPLGEADRLVSFLGRTSGRIRGVAGGARRIKEPLRLHARGPFSRADLVRRKRNARPGPHPAVRTDRVV